jgi:hypothetical protein
MGTWGAGILENDSSRDVYDEYLRLFEEGESASAIVRALKSEHLDAAEPQDRAEFWPAVALAQWECGELAEQTLKSLRRVIERGDGMDVWRAEGAAEAKKRERALAALLKKVAKKNTRPRKRGAKPRKRPPFEPGACVAFQFPDGRWGAVVAMKARPGWAGFNFIKVLKYRAAEKPPMEVFEARQWLSDSTGDPFVMQLSADHVQKSPGVYEQVGMLQLRAEDDYNYYEIAMGDVGTIVAKML